MLVTPDLPKASAIGHLRASNLIIIIQAVSPLILMHPH
jgi:hypothetical protein